MSLTNNSADGQGGGGYVSSGTFSLVDATAFSGNSTVDGLDGVAYVPGSTATLTNPPKGHQLFEPTQ